MTNRDVHRIPELEVNKGEQAMSDINERIGKEPSRETSDYLDEKLGIRHKEKKLRYHVDLAPEMGKSFTKLAEKMGLTLSAVVKLFLMDDWQKLQVSGFDYIYLGVADKPKGIPEFPPFNIK